MKPKPHVGQTVWHLPSGYARSRQVEPELVEMKVTKVGRKYFTAKEPHYSLEREYHIDTWQQKGDMCFRSSELYESPQAWEDDKELTALTNILFNFFDSRRKLTLEQARAIDKIINP